MSAGDNLLLDLGSVTAPPARHGKPVPVPVKPPPPAAPRSVIELVPVRAAVRVPPPPPPVKAEVMNPLCPQCGARRVISMGGFGMTTALEVWSCPSAPHHCIQTWPRRLNDAGTR